MKRWVVFAALFALGGAAPQPEGVVFIVSSRRHVSSVSSGDLRRIYLGQISRWSDGHRIVLLVRASKTPARRIFLDRVMHMSDIDYAQWWVGAIFRGDAASAPQVIHDDGSMVKAVAANPDAIGFLLATEPRGPDVQEIAVVPTFIRKPAGS